MLHANNKKMKTPHSIPKHPTWQHIWPPTKRRSNLWALYRPLGVNAREITLSQLESPRLSTAWPDGTGSTLWGDRDQEDSIIDAGWEITELGQFHWPVLQKMLADHRNQLDGGSERFSFSKNKTPRTNQWSQHSATAKKKMEQQTSPTSDQSASLVALQK